MKKVIVIGCPGSGKSTFARALAEKTGLPLHYLDMMDAKMFDMEAALAATKPGEFSDRVWTLDNRKLYKPTTDTE